MSDLFQGALAVIVGGAAGVDVGGPPLSAKNKRGDRGLAAGGFWPISICDFRY